MFSGYLTSSVVFTSSKSETLVFSDSVPPQYRYDIIICGGTRQTTFFQLALQLSCAAAETPTYLENVVLDVVDLDLLPRASAGSSGRQQRLEPESEEILVVRDVRTSSRGRVQFTHRSEAVMSRTLWP